MSKKKEIKEAREIIHSLETGNFYVECPCCGEPIQLKNAGLFYLDDFTPEAEELYQQRKAELKERERELKMKRKAIPERSKVTAKAVNIGFILERLAPSMRQFRFERNDCRSLFDPIDYLIFEGLTRKGSVSKIFFADIKTGSARLKNTQKEIKSIVERKQITWDTYKSDR